MYRKNQTKYIKKAIETKRLNKSFNTSSKEEYLYELLMEKYSVKRQYSSTSYPFSCDFYIDELELYVELNFTWTHGGHPFDVVQDRKKMDEWKVKANDSKYYNNAIYTWTDLDVRKLKCAKDNKLNYLSVYSKYPIEHIVDFISDNFLPNDENKQIIIGIK